MLVSVLPVNWVCLSSHWNLSKIFIGNKTLGMFSLQWKYIWVQLTLRVEYIKSPWNALMSYRCAASEAMPVKDILSEKYPSCVLF